MPTIYALLVGINNYPIPVRPLQGCINDVNAVEEYLQKSYPVDQLSIKKITDLGNEKPTRANVIAAFDHFNEATGDDICFFYYSGHGSFVKSPPEFWTDSGGSLQSIVCYDSRTPGGKDLLDKEISVLIWKTLIDKQNVRFVAITDCCHSGTITKAIDDTGVTDRMVPSRDLPVSLSEFYGYEQMFDNKSGYVVSEDGKRITVRQGNHIHIAASRDNQTSKELMIDDRCHGAFTHSMLKTLYLAGGNISYRELIDKSSILVSNLVKEQTPGANVVGELTSVEKERIFLSETLAGANSSFAVYKDPDMGWCIKGGLIHGIGKGDIVVVKDDSDSKAPKDVCTTEVTDTPLPDVSLLKPDAAMEAGKMYTATVQRAQMHALKLSFGNDVSPTLRALIEERWSNVATGYIELLKEGGQYIIRSNALNHAYITLPGSEQTVFEPRAVTSISQADYFINQVAILAKWIQIQEFNNPLSSLTNEHYELDLYRNFVPGKYSTDAFEPVKPIKAVNDLYYIKERNDWEQPAFRLRIYNKSAVPLWVTHLYLNFDYSITTLSTDEIEIAPGKEGWLKITENNLSSDVIKMMLDPRYRTLGYNEITEYVKLFIGTTKIDVSRLCQGGVNMPPERSFKVGPADRGFGSDNNETRNSAWKTETIGFRIVQPLPTKSISPGQSTTLYGMKLHTANLRAAVTLTSSALIFDAGLAQTDANPLKEKTKSILAKEKGFPPPPHTLFADDDLEPLDLAERNTRSAVAMDVLEFTDINNRDAVTRENPLIIEMTSTRSIEDEPAVLPMGFDVATGLYYPVGYTDANGRIIIESLPEETPMASAITQKSLFGSIKIYFQKVIGKKLGFAYDHPVLALVNGIDEEGKVDYETIPEKIRAEIGKPATKTVLLFIHGIIGDTQAMLPCIETPVDENETTFKKRPGTVILAFDYENLHTSIEESAGDLKKKLMAVGLGAGHTKELVIVAHSMGGLVSRWFIEKEDGNKMVSHLIMLGTPNNGTPWADVRDMVDVFATYAINGAAFLRPWMFVLSGIGRLLKGMQVTLKQMDSETGIYGELNKGAAPQIKYTIIAGNTQNIIVNYDGVSGAVAKLFSRLKSRGIYTTLDMILFKKPNDIAVTADSISTLSTTATWDIKPLVYIVDCDHLNYFKHLPALKLVYARL